MARRSRANAPARDGVPNAALAQLQANAAGVAKRHACSWLIRLRGRRCHRSGAKQDARYGASALLVDVQQAANMDFDRQLRDALRAARPMLALDGLVAEARTTFEQLRDESAARLREVRPHMERDAKMPRARVLEEELETLQHRQLNPAIRKVGMCRRQCEDANTSLEEEHSLNASALAARGSSRSCSVRSPRRKRLFGLRGTRWRRPRTR